MWCDVCVVIECEMDHVYYKLLLVNIITFIVGQ